MNIIMGFLFFILACPFLLFLVGGIKGALKEVRDPTYKFYERLAPIFGIVLCLIVFFVIFLTIFKVTGR